MLFSWYGYLQIIRTLSSPTRDHIAYTCGNGYLASGHRLESFFSTYWTLPPLKRSLITIHKSSSQPAWSPSVGQERSQWNFCPSKKILNPSSQVISKIPGILAIIEALISWRLQSLRFVSTDCMISATLLDESELARIEISEVGIAYGLAGL